MAAGSCSLLKQLRWRSSNPLPDSTDSVLQAKYYSRDFLVPGRVRVQLFRPDGKPLNSAIPDSKSARPRLRSCRDLQLRFYLRGLAGRTLLLRIAQLVPKHPGRSERAKAQAAKAVASSSQAATSKAGKKGKKGRK